MQEKTRVTLRKVSLVFNNLLGFALIAFGLYLCFFVKKEFLDAHLFIKNYRLWFALGSAIIGASVIAGASEGIRVSISLTLMTAAFWYLAANVENASGMGDTFIFFIALPAGIIVLLMFSVLFSKDQAKKMRK